jgi:hypothetical protein
MVILSIVLSAATLACDFSLACIMADMRIRPLGFALEGNDVINRFADPDIV